MLFIGSVHPRSPTASHKQACLVLTDKQKNTAFHRRIYELQEGTCMYACLCKGNLMFHSNLNSFCQGAPCIQDCCSLQFLFNVQLPHTWLPPQAHSPISRLMRIHIGVATSRLLQVCPKMCDLQTIVALSALEPAAGISHA